jgi:thioredoxin reductase (NADPH)
MREIPEVLDLIVVGAGPTGISIGAEARRKGLSVLVIDQGPLVASIQSYPTFMEFFTTRDRLEIADVPFAIPEVKPSRRQAVVYYGSVVERYGIPLATYERVSRIDRESWDGEEGFAVESHASRPGEDRRRRARAVVIATGYFDGPKRLGVEGEELSWVHHRYHEPYPFFGLRAVIVGGGNTAAEAALDLWRNGVQVTLVHRGRELKPGVKYWVKPDLENRIEEGSIPARFEATVAGFRPEGVEIESPAGRELLPADVALVLIGYRPDADFERRCGIEVDPVTLVPRFDPESCETNVPGLYVAGTLQAGAATDRIFIENSREHAPLIVASLLRRRAARGMEAAVV